MADIYSNIADRFMGGFQYGQQTSRQKALDMQAQQNQEMNLRQRALADAVQMQEAGYNVAPEQVLSAYQGQEGLGGMIDNRTAEYQRKAARQQQKEQLEDETAKLGIEKTKAEIGKLKREGGGNLLSQKVIEKQAEGIAGKTAHLVNIKGGMDTAIEQFNNPNTPEDEKIKIGEGLLKMLNSTEGVDAVGVQEADRMGSFLQYKLGNFTGPGSFIGRDLDLFGKQLENSSKALGERIRRNQEQTTSLISGRGFSLDTPQSGAYDKKLSKIPSPGGGKPINQSGGQPPMTANAFDISSMTREEKIQRRAKLLEKARQK